MERQLVDVACLPVLSYSLPFSLLRTALHEEVRALEVVDSQSPSLQD